MASFEQMMNAFGVVTVMNACVYKLKNNISYVGRGSCAHGETNSGALKPDDFVCTGLYLDTLKIANLTQEGPTKTITGGQYANPLLKYGKTMTIEMQDALGRAPVLVEFFGCDYEDGVLSVTDKFPGAFAIEGDTFFIDQKTGEKVDVHILIPQLLPDAILNLTQDAEGDAAVFDLNGTISVTSILDGNKEKDVFYQIREESWFGTQATAESTGIDGYHELPQLAAPVFTNDEIGGSTGNYTVTWSAIPNAQGYEIYNSIGSKTVTEVLSSNTTTYTALKPAIANEQAIVRVRAIGDNTNYSDSTWTELTYIEN